MITTSPFTVIEGGGETQMIQPRLVKDEHGRICMEVRLGAYTATLPLPEQFANATKEQLQAFFDEVVPVMTKGLQEMARKDRRKFRKKAAKCVNGSTRSEPKSPEEIPVARQPH